MQNQQQPPEDLLSAFKAAALSVTTLYKTAATSQARERAAGYQDALDDVLTFLDRENLGLQDGEGWRVRQWATERLDGRSAARADSEEDDEEDAEDERPHTAPTIIQRDTDETPHHDEPESEAPSNMQNHPQATQPQQPTPTPQAFSFQSSHQYPTNHDREVHMDDTTGNNDEIHGSDGTPVRVEPLPRTTRPRAHRTTISRSSTIRGNLGNAAGSKRKIPYGDFFDLGGLSFDKDHHDKGPKRGRHA